MKILLVGHACSPVRGSEPGMTWNHAAHLAELGHDVWLITHPHYKHEVDAELVKVPRPTLHIEYVTLPPESDPWDPAKGEHGLKKHYLRWQHAALARARQLIREHGLQIAHHLSWGTVNAPPALHELSIPLAWGPLGGGETMPWAFRQYFGGTIKNELVRIAISKAMPFVPALRKMSGRAYCLASNWETRAIVVKGGAKRVELFLDCGLAKSYAADATPDRPFDGTLQLLWAGRHEHRKALPLALEALAKTRSNVRLTVAGDGPLRSEWEASTASMSLAGKVDFVGSVPWATMKSLYERSHAFLFTSLRDRFGTVVLEAMAHGLPIVTLDHNGVRCFVPDDGGIKVPVTTPAEVTDGLARGIDALAADPGRRQAMAETVIAFSRTQSWDRRAAWIADLYQAVIDGKR